MLRTNRGRTYDRSRPNRSNRQKTACHWGSSTYGLANLDSSLSGFSGAPVETGKEQAVQVRCNEGVAIRIGPEPCVGVREGDGEASAGERIGQPWSRESPQSRAPTWSETRKATRTKASRESLFGPAWSKNLACAEALCAGTGRSRAWPADGHRRSASGRRGVVADDGRAREV